MTPFERSLAAVETAEKELAKLEDHQIAVINKTLESSLQKLLVDLRGKWGDRGGVDLLGRDRAILLANDLRDTLNIFNPNSSSVKAIESELTGLIQKASEVGDKSARAGYLEKGFGATSTANLSLDVAVAAAKSAHLMLQNHGSQFASNTSVAIQQGILLGFGYQKTARLVQTLGEVTKSRAETIIRTETVRAAASAMTERFKADGIDKVIWVATQDKRCCPRCASLAGTILDRDKVVLPLHPRDRCTVIAYKESWDKLGLVDRDWLENHQKETFILSGGSALDFKVKSLPTLSPLPEPPKALRVYGELPKGVTKVIETDERHSPGQPDYYRVDAYDFTVGTQSVRLSINEGSYSDKKGFAEVIFTVNKRVDRQAGDNGRTIALTIARSFQHDAANRPDGYKYYNAPHMDDGAGDDRIKAYKAMGFAGDKKGMYAVVINGKAVPADKKGKPLSKPESPKKPTIPELTKAQEKLINDPDVTNDRDRSRRDNILKLEPQIKSSEAQAFAHYIGDYFEDINRTFWDKSFKKQDPESYHQSKAIAAGVSIAIAKIKPITAESLSAEIAAMIGGKGEPMAPDGRLTHNMNIKDPKLLSTFLGDRPEGSTISADKFFSTSWAAGGEAGFNNNVNIEFRVLPRLDGGGQGRLVDRYKNEIFENEVLFPPEAKFKVTERKIIKAVEEVSHVETTIQHNENYTMLSQIAKTLKYHIETPGLKILDGKSWTFSDSSWEPINESNQLPPYPKTKEQAEAYLKILEKKIAVESKEGVPTKIKIIDSLGTPEKHLIYVTEI